MDLSKLKSLIFFAIFLLFSLYVRTTMGRPTTSRPRRMQAFLLQLYKKMISSGTDVPAQTVHGVVARVKSFRGGVKHSPNVTVFTTLAFVSSFVKKTKKTHLHLHVESRANDSSTAAVKQQLVQAVCKLHIHNVKTNKEIKSKIISCTQSGTYVITLTRFVNKWLKSTSKNLAVRVRISSNSTNVPAAFLPFINLSSHAVQPYYVLYV